MTAILSYIIIQISMVNRVILGIVFIVFYNMNSHAQIYSVQILNYRTAISSALFQIPERDNLIFGRSSVKRVIMNNNTINGFGISRTFGYEILKEVSLEYQQLVTGISGPDINKPMDLIERSVKLHKINGRLMLLKTKGDKFNGFFQLGLSRFVFVGQSARNSKSIRNGLYKSREDSLVFSDNYLPLPFNFELNFGFDYKLFNIAQKPLRLRISTNIMLREVLTYTLYWPNKTYVLMDVPNYYKSIVLGITYSINK
jgi:hypothetical protein